ncbi:MAG TPA: hypothetical protein VLL48_09055 [Longimicrobiales bacterium]|nr:hypothetical protein [Longimicrobiales bacterium]
MVVGGGGLFGVELPGRTRMDGGVSVYRHVLDGRLDGSDWSQLRIWSGLRVDLGDDPGRRGRLRR